MNASAPKGPLLSLREAAEHLRIESKHPAQWLRRYLLRREEEIGRPVLVRVGRGQQRPTYRVSIAKLRLTCPELFDTRDQLERAVRGLGGALGKRLDSISEAVDEQAASMAALAEGARKR